MDDIIRVWDVNFSDILLDQKSYKTYKDILIYDISYKISIDATPLRIRFDEINGYIKIYDGIRYLVLFTSERYNKIYDRVRYHISKRSDITNIGINYNFPRIRID